MTIHELELEDYLWFVEYQQGNVNIAGLVFDDLLEDELSLDHEVYHVWIDIIVEDLTIAEDFNPYHLPSISENIDFSEFFGSPLRVKQTVLNVVTQDILSPALIAHVHMNVLHGPDVYWEEVSDELQCTSSYVNAVPYYWEWVYESWNMEVTDPDPEPSLYVTFNFTVTDLLVSTDTQTQDYLYNSKCDEILFLWDLYAWGWDMDALSSLICTDAIQEAIGKVAEDSLYFEDLETIIAKTNHLMDETLMAYDTSIDEKYYVLESLDTFDLSDLIVDAYGVTIEEIIILDENTIVPVFLMLNTTDSILTQEVLDNE